MGVIKNSLQCNLGGASFVNRVLATNNITMDNRSLAVVIIIILLVVGIIVFAAVSSPNDPLDASPMPTVTDTPDTSIDIDNINNDFSTSTATTSSGTGTSNTSSRAQNYKISYTNAGFTPSVVTIRKGDSVTFTNNSSERMWVASSPHPTHTDYPEFDQKVSVGTEVSWSFTFDEAGTYPFHNHSSSTKFGRVVVQ